MIVYASSSTGTSSVAIFEEPVTKLAVQVNAACTYLVQGSLNGDSWATVMASSTAAASSIRTSTANLLVAQARVVFSANAGTSSFRCELVGK